MDDFEIVKALVKKRMKLYRRERGAERRPCGEHWLGLKILSEYPRTDQTTRRSRTSRLRTGSELSSVIRTGASKEGRCVGGVPLTDWRGKGTRGALHAGLVLV